MSIDELKATIERRGFHLIVWIPESDCVKMVVRLGDFSMPYEVSLATLESINIGVDAFISMVFGRIIHNHTAKQPVDDSTA